MLKIFDVDAAKQTILKRAPVDDIEVTPAVRERITRMFGEPLTPAQVVDRIIRDIRSRGDEALAAWTGRLDGSRPAVFAVPEEEMQSSLAALPAEQREALALAVDRVRRFH